jgi:hypothetical protein
MNLRIHSVNSLTLLLQLYAFLPAVNSFSKQRTNCWKSFVLRAVIEVGSETLEEAQPDDFKLRFNNVARLYGNADVSLSYLKNAHVCVIGLGGVGSWCVEALARSGIGKMTLVDMDDVCISNTNRQIQAMTSTVSRPIAFNDT